MKRQEWKEKAAEMSGVPKDVAMGLPILTITGTNDLCVENYRGMTEYTDQIIRLQSKSGQIKITGKKLGCNEKMLTSTKYTGTIT